MTGLELTKNTAGTFTRADIVPYSDNGDYFPIPNYPISDVLEDAITLEINFMNSPFNDFEPTISHPVTRGGRYQIPRIEAVEMRKELDKRMEVIVGVIYIRYDIMDYSIHQYIY